ncbi:phospholipase D-like domain-containing protein [Mycoplasma sp. 1018B]|uniref:phospholipase D-like domain-containing protein n=1 Tax=Mycoplasma sp. 1018B TaxID=2967302 RepID=UPI00211C5F9E|nr:phospholipase D-like domain-containing protein [Mycoplasma sp. 1018B]UUM19019.1 phospholipase D-like domain-containing protein [Mycoplasma sp. 1018B]
MKKSFNWIIYILEILLFLALVAGILYFTFVSTVHFFIFFTFLAYLINLIIALTIFSQFRPASSKLSWLIFFFLFPVVGVLFYLTFGNKYKNKKEKKMIKDKIFNLNNYSEQFKNFLVKEDNLDYFKQLNKSLILPGNYQFYQYTSDYFNELFQQLKKAKKTIFIMSYIIKPGEILQELLDILIERASRGIKIYWLIDDFGRTLTSKNKYFKELLINGNIEIIFISKLVYPFIHSQNFYRNHQKFYIIDQKIVFAGGCNISDEYISLSKKYGDWIDLNYKLTGLAINSYILQFIRSWYLWSNKNTNLNVLPSNYFNLTNNEINNANSILTTDSPVYDSSYLEYNLLGLITKAKKTIKIVTPYFSVPDSLFNALKIMLFSNVEIEVYFPGYADKQLIWNSSINSLIKLEEYGLKIYLYKDTFIHSKCGLIDDEIAFFGSSNMDMRSMYAQYELMDIITGSAVIDLKNIIENYKSKSVLFNKKIHMTKQTPIKKIFYDLIRPIA